MRNQEVAMPDIQIFDAAGFFDQKISEIEQVLIVKKAELEILYANRTSLEQTVVSLSRLSPENQRAIGVELNSLKEVQQTTERVIGSLEGEIEMLGAKHRALLAACTLLPLRDPR
jgi:hypothetical protein